MVNALRAQRGPYPVAPPTGPNPPTPLSGEPQFCPQILRKTPGKLPPPTRLGDAVGLVGRLGGWLGRTRDPPGAQLLWHGYTQLVAMAFAFELRDEFG